MNSYTSRGRDYVVPQIEEFSVKPRCYRYQTHEKKVEKFLNSKDFQELCQTDSRMREGRVIFITIGRGENFYLFGQEGCVDGMRFATRRRENLRDYKCDKVIGNPEFADERIFVSANYLLTIQNDQWKAVRLVCNYSTVKHPFADDCLQVKKIEQANQTWANHLGFLTKGKAFWAEGVIFPETEKPMNKLMAVQEAYTADGEKRYLVCLVDSGKMLLLNEAELTCQRVLPVYHKLWKSKFSWYQFEELGCLSRVK